MDFIEGAILVVGGIWLVGVMSRQSASHPLNAGAATVTPVSAPDSEPTLAQSTNTAGVSSIVAGEPLTTGTDSNPAASPILPVNRAVANPIIAKFLGPTMPTAGGGTPVKTTPVTTAPVSSGPPFLQPHTNYVARRVYDL